MRSTIRPSSRARWLAPLALAFATSIAAGGCQHAQASRPQTASAPEGEVWLTAAEVAQMHLAIVPVADQPIDDTILAAGKIAFDDSRVSHTFSPVSGRVTRIEASLGQRVHHGDPLVVIESPEIGIASSDLGKAQADVIAAEHDLARQRELVAQGAASNRDLEQADDAYRRARAELQRAQERARLFHAGSTSNVTQTYTVRSELDGEIITRNLNPGMEIQGQYTGGTPMELFTIGSLDRVWMLADVFEMDLARIHVGAHVDIHVIAYPDRVFHSTVDLVSGTLDPQTRTAKVRCVLDNPDGLLRPEMYATAAITVDATRTLAVPHSALLRLGDSIVVFVQSGNAPGNRLRFVRTPVQADEGEESRLVPVTHGLEEGQLVVTDNAIQLLGML